MGIVIPRVLSRSLLVFGLAYTCFGQNTVPDLQISRKERLAIFSKVWETVNNNFYDPKFNGMDWPQMKLKYRPQAEAAADTVELLRVLQTMLRELKVSHTSIGPTPFLYNGINFSSIEGRQIVRFVDPKSRAHAAGVESGWLVTTSQGSCNYKGDVNTISFTDAQQRTHKVEVPCDYYSEIPLPDSISRTLDNGTPYIRFPKFRYSADEWLADEVRKSSNAPAIILDLRGNRGGDLDVLRRCLGLFLPSGTLFGIVRDRKGSEERLPVARSKYPPYQGRVFLMIDEETGSAGEVFAAAMQDTSRATLLGRTSVGAVLIGHNHKLPAPFNFSVAHYDYHTLKGVRLEGHGVIPDHVIPKTLRDYVDGRDPDMEFLLDLMKK